MFIFVGTIKIKDERNNFVSASSLILDTNFNDKKIAGLLNLPLDFVQRVRLILA